MSYKIENINGCTKKIIFSFEELDLGNEIKSALSKKRAETSIKGFRKGKAPLQMIEKLYRPQVESDALNQFIQAQFYKVITDEKLRISGYPSIENMKYEGGDSVSFDAVVEVFPEVELNNMSGLKFKMDKFEVTDEEVEESKKSYLNSKSEMVEVTEEGAKVENGFHAVMNFQGVKEDGERPENMAGKEYVLEIGSGQFIPGFEEGMIGMCKGEKKEIEVTFPEDYHAEDLKNAKVVFEVELLEIKEKKLPDFTDELAKELGFESTEDFQVKTSERLLAQKEKQAREKVNQEILEKLVEENQFDVPGSMVAEQEKFLKQDMEKSLKQQGYTEDMIEAYLSKVENDFSSRAEFQVKSGLILDKIATEHNVEANEEDFNKKIEETAKNIGLDVEQIKQYYSSDEKIKRNMMYAIREEKTLDKIKELVTVE